MSIAIKAENISKAYQIGEFSTGTITKDIERWWALMRGKEDPYLKIGETNDRSTKGESNIVWSLKDINFDIQQGDAVGIIGKNGAGKSTLLKILSRVTTPTTGSVKVKGRIASLLEVGTGFHPELTGKENIYLNGAILGMRKHEIKKHFDAIVDFSGVERYIDTPVKRYSSGMYVRLAFAVAAHLESEILIVDEVLAVGDAEFQKKCLGKMGEVSKGEGRTVLFVSHNMGSISQLCNKGILLHNGQINSLGKINYVIDQYSSIEKRETTYKYDPSNVSSDVMYIEEVYLTDNQNTQKSTFGIEEYIKVFVKFKVNKFVTNSQISVTIQSKLGDYLTTIIEDVDQLINPENENSCLVSFKLQNNIIAANSYFIRVALFVLHKDTFDLLEMICPFKVYDSGSKLARLEGINYGNYIINYDLENF